MKTINCIADIRHFCTVGISYKKSDAHNRGKFAVCPDQYEVLLKHAKHYGITSVFVLSTCNRTEIYGLTDNISNLVNLLCSVTVGKRAEFEAHCYKKTGVSAVNQLFNVAAGLDSQILGDYEIVGQLKQAVKFAKERGFIDGFLEKLYNTALQASKQVKNEVNLSKGSTSVSFAAVQLIKQHGFLKADSKILIVGAGKMGRLSCKNLIGCPAKPDITVVNRSVNKAREIAAEMNINYADIADLESLIKVADAIVVASGAAYPVIFKSHFVGTGEKLVVDLAVPRNVDPEVAKLANIKLVRY
ncbi:glutamyl-tRNA reductase [Mucilaginibacter celer]|uniref:glutamyl-tRNA reductase n=1 Tax=Mucilaginibacter celer TaxID=2305508 RepID=UPI0013CF274A|nr:glutamyl-tRNA reductase [Mucilaginibacter celer]